MQTIYALVTQIFYAQLIALSILDLVIFIASLLCILYQILLLHTPNLQLYRAKDILHLITKLKPGLNIYLLSQGVFGLTPEALLV